jgi:hypothetical protein
MGVFVELHSTNTPNFLILREYTLENKFYAITLLCAKRDCGF